jgi:hypothetical protein
MDLSVSLEVVATNEALVAVIAFELTITKVGLNVRLNVLFAAETFVAILVSADPLVVRRLRTLDELRNVVNGDVGFLNGGFDAGLEVEIRDRHASRR